MIWPTYPMTELPWWEAATRINEAKNLVELFYCIDAKEFSESGVFLTREQGAPSLVYQGASFVSSPSYSTTIIQIA